ncbi:cold-shock protein [Oceanibacterium hippocampi]|uniref:Cold shock protein CspV n=1 Tax=Oceanibacterium hippocampi TaxID=745714 RepID=A0A1Y5TYF7_9PROT|nr:cold-shock protein [Oceanibacterium hippocampi]SLN76952.1 Cold shock protein CspV [Oceanibacterium hippocampi]
MTETPANAGPADEERVVVEGRVKWFNTVKGFGFITPPEEEGDVFVHLTCLREAGHEGLIEGATVRCEAIRRPKGLQAVRVIAVDNSTATGPELRPTRPPTTQLTVDATGEFVETTVKWFDPVKGYGFLTRGEGTQDIFVHMETLRREGIVPLQPGQRLRVRIGIGPKGPQAAEIEQSTAEPIPLPQRLQGSGG